MKEAMKRRHTRKELRHLFFLGTARAVPSWANLREYVATWHVQQQNINNGGKVPRFWKKAVGLDA